MSAPLLPFPAAALVRRLASSLEATPEPGAGTTTPEGFSALLEPEARPEAPRAETTPRDPRGNADASLIEASDHDGPAAPSEAKPVPVPARPTLPFFVPRRADAPAAEGAEPVTRTPKAAPVAVRPERDGEAAPPERPRGEREPSAPRELPPLRAEIAAPKPQPAPPAAVRETPTPVLRPVAGAAAPEGGGMETSVVPRRMDFVLEPARLGAVRMTLTLVGSGARLVVSAANEAGFAALRSDADLLLPILRDIRGSDGTVQVVLQMEPGTSTGANTGTSTGTNTGTSTGTNTGAGTGNGSSAPGASPVTAEDSWTWERERQGDPDDAGPDRRRGEGRESPRREPHPASAETRDADERDWI